MSVPRQAVVAAAVGIHLPDGRRVIAVQVQVDQVLRLEVSQVIQRRAGRAVQVMRVAHDGQPPIGREFQPGVDPFGKVIDDLQRAGVDRAQVALLEVGRRAVELQRADRQQRGVGIQVMADGPPDGERLQLVPGGRGHHVAQGERLAVDQRQTARRAFQGEFDAGQEAVVRVALPPVAFLAQPPHELDRPGLAVQMTQRQVVPFLGPDDDGCPVEHIIHAIESRDRGAIAAVGVGRDVRSGEAQRGRVIVRVVGVDLDMEYLSNPGRVGVGDVHPAEAGRELGRDFARRRAARRDRAVAHFPGPRSGRRVRVGDEHLRRERKFQDLTGHVHEGRISAGLVVDDRRGCAVGEVIVLGVDCARVPRGLGVDVEVIQHPHVIPDFNVGRRGVDIQRRAAGGLAHPPPEERRPAVVGLADEHRLACPRRRRRSGQLQLSRAGDTRHGGRDGIGVGHQREVLRHGSARASRCRRRAAARTRWP